MQTEDQSGAKSGDHTQQGVLFPRHTSDAVFPRDPGCHPRTRDQQRHRRNRGAAGGRPVTYDQQAYRGRNVVERAFNQFKQWRGLATRYDKLA